MKTIVLKRNAEVTSSFIELARVVEGCSALDATESIEIAKQVMFSVDGIHETPIEVGDEVDTEHLRIEFGKYGVDVSFVK